jgi:hypothetical protein
LFKRRPQGEGEGAVGKGEYEVTWPLIVPAYLRWRGLKLCFSIHGAWDLAVLAGWDYWLQVCRVLPLLPVVVLAHWIGAVILPFSL